MAKKKASPSVLSALTRFATATRKIGKGTGRNAVRYRRDAKQQMGLAYAAVPCWIMSQAKVSESIPAKLGTFDLVIIDEASQSDLWAMPAALRGKRVLVVGDDKQVSPAAIGTSANEHEEVLRRHLSDQPFKTEMTFDKSFYDLAAAVFADRQVMLREHFRCAPAIIAYSNRNFYKDQIKPVRIPTAEERIEPPLVDVYVEGGVWDLGRDRNDGEADFIATEIAGLISDPKFAGRTIGVATLLGTSQAERIRESVRKRCDDTELRRRQFVCGDARAFQGRERDIMFLSLVVSPETIGSRKSGRSHFTAQAGVAAEQRFNVAASRARDRMYLVRSVKTADLSPSDLRMQLLAHFEKPIVAGTDASTELMSKCDSNFERDMLTELLQRGYRVSPQVETGGYSIDMVIEGAGSSRLAIECDGDPFHSGDRWAQDMHRQRVLERAGWTFWRCFYSDWIRDRDGKLQELVDVLEHMGIGPIGAMDRIPELVEQRTYRFISWDPVAMAPAEVEPA
jgi:very-short-patch-repair endonuclease